MTAGTWWRTVRHLKARQIVGRAVFRLRRPVPDLRPAPPCRRRVGPWGQVARRTPSLTGPATFQFLNVELSLPPLGWNVARADRLWLYNLHYFDDLNSWESSRRAAWHRELVSRWIGENPPGTGTGWEPYPISRRIVNWVKWFLSGTSPEPDWLDSLAAQARWLRQRMEIHLLGNHLFANAKALVFAGLYFDGAEAEDWLHEGARILMGEIDEQVLGDGGHFERSPMYHALALEDVLDLINACAVMCPDDRLVAGLALRLRECAGRLLVWLRCMVHPSGSLARFNDCADGIAPGLEELEKYARSLKINATPRPGTEGGITHFADSGYVRWERDEWVVLLDVAPIGPDYLPGHAHADTLSFELSLAGEPLIRNGGTSRYGVSERRLRERRTSSHNTVEVAGSDSSEVWHGFRVGRRARPKDLEVGDGLVACSHDGYSFLPGRPQHRRTWSLTNQRLHIVDTVTPRADSIARYFLAPGFSLVPSGPARWQVNRGASAVVEVTVPVGTAITVRAAQAQGFGVVDEVDCLEIRLEDGKAETIWCRPAHAYSLPD